MSQTNARLQEIWDRANESERHGFQFALFPSWTQTYNLTHEEIVDLMKKSE